MKRITLLFIMLSLSGCSSTIGNKGTQDQLAIEQIKPGVTTKAEVKELVGEPSYVTFFGTEETWSFIVSEAQVRAATFIPIVGLFAGGSDFETHTLTIQFKGDVVQRYAKGGQEGSVGTFYSRTTSPSTTP